MKPLSHNYRRFPQNPFLKERLVRAHPEDHEHHHEEHKSEAPREDESDFVRQLKEMMETNVDYENRKSIEANWGVLTSEYERWERYQRWVEEQKTLLESPNPTIKDEEGKDVPWDIEKSVWRERVSKIGKLFDEAKSEIGSDWLSGSFAAAYQQQVHHEIKPQIIKDCERMIAQVAGYKETIEEELKQQMHEDFLKRLDWLNEQWEKHPPEFLTKPGMEAILANRRAIVIDAQNQIRAIKGDVSREEMLKIWGGLKSLELLYFQEQHTDHKSKEISYPSLRARVLAAKAKKEEAIQRVQERFDKEKRDTLAQLQATLSAVQGANHELFGHGDHGAHKQHEVIHDLEERIKSIKDGGSLRSILEAALSSTEIRKDEHGHDNPLGATLGLEGQVELLNNPKLSEADKITWMEGLDGALHKYEELVKNDESLMFSMPALRKQAEDLLQQIQNQPSENCVNFFTNKYKLYFLSPYNSTRAVTIVQEWAKRLYDRRADKNLSVTGSNALKFLEKLPVVRTLPNEFGKIGDTAEQGEVHQFEEAYKNRDAWQITEMAESTGNEDEFRACLQLLAHHGRLRWDRIGILRQFNRFQNVVHFDVSSYKAVEREARDMSAFEHKLERACEIWDSDAWAALDRQNKSAYDHELKETEKRASANSAQLVDTLNHLLHNAHDARKKNPDDYYADGAKIESHQYDEYVKFGIESGTFNTYQGLYYVIQGLGTGIIPMERVSQYRNDFMNSYPVMEFINIKHPELKDGGDRPLSIDFFRNVASLTEDEFQLFFYDHVIRNKSVRERLDKTVTSGKRLDHDMVAGFFPYMSTASMKTMLRKSAEGGTVMPETGILNASAAEDFFLDHFTSINDKERKVEDLTTFASSFVLFNGIITGRLFANQDYGTLSRTSMNQKPRSQNEFEKLSGVSGKSMYDNLEGIKKKLVELDGDFFGFIFNQDGKDTEVPALVEKLRGRYGSKLFEGLGEINTVNVLAERTSDFLEFIADTPAGRAGVQKMIAKITHEQHARHAPDATIPRESWQWKLMSGKPAPRPPAAGGGHGGH